jgi:hypothetical protein
MPGIREQGQRVTRDPSDQLDHKDCRTDGEGSGEATPMLSGRASVVHPWKGRRHHRSGRAELQARDVDRQEVGDQGIAATRRRPEDLAAVQLEPA